MNLRRGLHRFSGVVFLLLALGLLPAPAAWAQEPADAAAVYAALKNFELATAVQVQGVTLKRDRAQITFDGMVYAEAPVAGRVRGAVLVGNGTFRAAVPESIFERDHVRRMLKVEEVIESTFRTAVLRFTDDSFEILSKDGAPLPGVSSEAGKLAAEFDSKLLRETGANVASRLLVSILNQEQPGVFIAQFDKGSRGRFTLVLDYQSRIPTQAFDINGGEKGLLFAYKDLSSDVWMAFFAEEDYQRGRVEYSDAFDLVETPHYQMEVDLREPKKRMGLRARMEMVSNTDGLRAVPMNISESLTEYDSIRLKQAMRARSAKLADGTPVLAVQEDWEGGLTLVLPRAYGKGEPVVVELEAEGDFLYQSRYFSECFYPYVNGQWYPRHGYLNRSTFHITYLHQKKARVSSSGVLVRSEALPDSKDHWLSEWRMPKPVALVTFALGPFEVHTEKVKMEKGGELTLDFYSLSGGLAAIKEDFILAEMNNSVRYFSVLFGNYEYPRFGAVFHPFGFGQGFASMLLIPDADRASKYTYSFIAHETAHQWWGNIVAWRSYRDQWLSEGFAEYSGILYTGLRDKPRAARDLLDDLRRSLKNPPVTDVGVGKGRVADIGPIILGHRLFTRQTRNAYGTLIYNKGALVLRMLHFLFTNPADGDGQPFFDMMSDFVNRHRDGWATTENFWRVAGEHFARTPVARKYGLKDLDWFFSQWVYQAHLPSYRFEYQIENQPGGGVVVHGNVVQEGVPEKFFMVLPLVFQFGKDQVARGTVHAFGPRTAVSIPLPMRPSKVELDPDWWVLSDKTETKGR